MAVWKAAESGDLKALETALKNDPSGANFRNAAEVQEEDFFFNLLVVTYGSMTPLLRCLLRMLCNEISRTGTKRRSSRQLSAVITTQ